VVQARPAAAAGPVPGDGRAARCKTLKSKQHSLRSQGGSSPPPPSHLEHRQNGLVSPAMGGPPQRGDPAGDAREGVGLAAAGGAHGAGARVLGGGAAGVRGQRGAGADAAGSAPRSVGCSIFWKRPTALAGPQHPGAAGSRPTLRPAPPRAAGRPAPQGSRIDGCSGTRNPLRSAGIRAPLPSPPHLLVVHVENQDHLQRLGPHGVHLISVGRWEGGATFEGHVGAASGARGGARSPPSPQKTATPARGKDSGSWGAAARAPCRARRGWHCIPHGPNQETSAPKSACAPCRARRGMRTSYKGCSRRMTGRCGGR
jgi:hypothetical protein